jgi:Asp-tRNA(Asn)/Glu-tRNA(Gln) amidotransferase C subunit
VTGEQIGAIATSCKEQSWSHHQGTDDSWMRKDAITEQMPKNAFLSKFLTK